MKLFGAKWRIARYDYGSPFSTMAHILGNQSPSHVRIQRQHLGF